MTDQRPPKGIWYISKYIAPPGPSKVGSRGYQLMRKLAESGDSVAIVTSDSNHLATVPRMTDSYWRQDVDGMNVFWVRTMKFVGAKSFRRILSWLHFEWRLLFLPWKMLPKPDAVIVSSLSLLTILNGIRLKRQFGAILVFEVRDIWPLTLTEEGGFSPKNPLVKLLGLIERLGYANSDIIVGTMPNLGAHVFSVLGRRRRTECVPMGFTLEDDVGVGPLPKAYLEAAVPEADFLVGYVGSIGISNALETFFESAAALEHQTGIHFVVVGDGDLLPHYQKKYEMHSNITFVGRVPKRSVQTVLTEFDLLYLSVHQSSVWDYGQSLNKLVDYMLSGKPVLASYSGHQSMINEADSGVFVEAGDSIAVTREILRLSKMPAEELRAMGERGATWLRAHREYGELASDYRRILFGSSVDDIGAQ